MNLFEQIGSMTYAYKNYTGEYPEELWLGRLTHHILKQDCAAISMWEVSDPKQNEPDMFMGMRVKVDYSKYLYLEVK